MAHPVLEKISNLNGSNMKKVRFTEAQIISILKQQEAGILVREKFLILYRCNAEVKRYLTIPVTFGFFEVEEHAEKQV